MTDIPPSPGPGWWLASDGRWYPPETAPPQPDGWNTNQLTRTDQYLPPTPAADEPWGQPAPSATQDTVYAWTPVPPAGLAPPAGQPPAPGAPPPGLGFTGPGSPGPGAPGLGSPGSGVGGPGLDVPHWPGVGQPSPRSKGSSTLWLVLGVAVAVLVLLIGGGLIVARTGGSDDASGSSTTGGTGSTVAPSSTAAGTTASSASSSTTRPTTTGSATSTTAPTTTPASRLDQNQSITDRITEQFGELAIDFSDGSDVEGPTSCAVTGLQNDGSGDYAVDATVHNADGVASAYQVDYDLIGPDGSTIGSDFGVISRIEPGQTVVDDTIGTVSGDADWRQVSCEVTGTVRVDAA